MSTKLPPLFTVGYVTFEPDKFVEQLKQHGITALADVRSSPYSAHKSDFNKEHLETLLKKNGIAYVFLGEGLGARFPDQSVYSGGMVDYEAVAEHQIFQAGLDRLRKGMQQYKIVLMCAEKDPVNCHRALLICRNFKTEADIYHIHADGKLESHSAMENRLRKINKLEQLLLVGDPLSEAYRRQARKVAFHAGGHNEDN